MSTLQKIFRKRIYMGDFDYAGATYKGVHQALVSREVWERVQAILDRRQEKKRREAKHDFAYSGMLRCGHCGCSLVGEVKKGRYVYYHCTGYRGKCAEPYTREEALEREFAGGLRELIIDPAIMRWLEADLVGSDETERAARARALRRLQAELERCQARLEVI